MPSSNLIVFGYDELLLELLKFFSRHQAQISAVVFPSNRNDARADKIRQIVRDQGYLIIEQPPQKQIGEFAKEIRRLKPDLFFVWSYPMILPAEIIKIPRRGSINLHMGLLPEYRGVNGVRWALVNGDVKTGLTLHLMNSGIDAGDIISRVTFPITTDDDIRSLMIKSKTAGLHLLEHHWQTIAADRFKTVAQDESKARYYSAEMSSFETIDWSKSNIEIHNLIRASVVPFPGVHTFWNQLKLTLRKSVPIENSVRSEANGTVAKFDTGSLEITTGSGNLHVTEVELEGRAVPIGKLIDLGIRVGSRFQNS